MNSNIIRLEVDGEELKKIFKELEKAQEKIYDCYTRLEAMGVLTITGATEDDAPVNK